MTYKEIAQSMARAMERLMSNHKDVQAAEQWNMLQGKLLRFNKGYNESMNYYRSMINVPRI